MLSDHRNSLSSFDSTSGGKDIYFYGYLFTLFKDNSDNNTFSTLAMKTVSGLPAFQHWVCIYVSCFCVAGSAPISRTFPCWQYFVTWTTRYLCPEWAGLFICLGLWFPSNQQVPAPSVMKSGFFICQAARQYLSISLLLAFKWSLIYNSSLVYHSGLF